MMLRALSLVAFLSLAACGGVVSDTTLAERAEVRRQMVESVRIGVTTETGFVTRWGPPLQKVREGARTEFIYRTRTAHGAYVIVTFDHKVAVAVRSADTEGCRGTFPLRMPGYGWDRPDPVTPVGWCGAAARPLVPDDAYGGPGTEKVDRAR